MRARITLGIALLGSLGSANAQLVESWEQAKQVAAASGRLIVVDFWADWCGPCKRFDAASESDAALRARLESVVLFKTDAERAGKELAQSFGVGGYPTYVVANARGETVGRWWGFESAAEWLDKFDAIQADPTTMEEKAQRFAESPTARDAFVLGRFHETQDDFVTGIEFYTKALALDPEHARDYEDALFEAAYGGHREGVVAYDVVEQWAQRALAWDPPASSEELYALARTMTSAARREGRPELAARYLEKGLAALANSSDESAMARHTALAIDHALIVEKDKPKALELKRTTLEAGWDQDPDSMNGFAWWCFENDLNLEEAERVARAAVELAETDGDKANILDTVAEICNLRGDCREAVSLIQQALELNPNSDYLKRQLVRFEKALEATG